jgi:MATE family multidrug resistance protein
MMLLRCWTIPKSNFSIRCFLGALRGLQDVKIPMYITCGVLSSAPISYYLGKYTETQGCWNLIGLLAGLTAAAIFLYIRFARLTKVSFTKS